MRCTRCLTKTDSHTMSMFNRDEICLPCKQDEIRAPGYEAARDAEAASCATGQFNYPGVGLSVADDAFLATRRNERTTP